MKKQRSADIGEMTHWAEVEPLTSLMIDLRKQLLGRKDFQPVTSDRLDECSKAIQKIMQCRTRRLFKIK